MKAKKITLKGFRGSTQSAVVSFDTSKSLSLIFGENGTGKSTIVDGFDFLCNQNFGSLENYSIGKSAKTYIPSHGYKSSDCSVELTSDKGIWKATLSGSGITVAPDSIVPDARILRRPAILRLIEAEPKKRFEELKNFISVPNTDKTENVFRDAIKETKKLFDEYSRSLSQANDALEKLWIDSGKKGISAILWADEKVKADISQDQSQIDDIDLILMKISDAEKAYNLLKASILTEETALKTENEAKKKQIEFEQKQKDKDSELLLLLQKAKTYIHGHSDIGKCPVCETVQDITTLMDRMTSRISEMEVVKTFVSVTQQASSLVEAKKVLRIEAENKFIEKLKSLIEKYQSVKIEITSLVNIDEKYIQDIQVAAKYSSNLSEDFTKWHDNFVSICKNDLNKKKEEHQRYITLRTTIQNHLNTVNEKKVSAISKEKSLAELNDILQIIEKERKDYIEGILNLISQEVSSLYSSLHPVEQLGKARFYLKPKQIGSLEFDASFQGTEEIPPQAYYSESHLDTLGICVFIALSKYYKTDNTILVLDDVLTSVDAQHMDRFMKMLHEQSKIFNQIIVTTHYRPWKDRYKHTRSSVSNIDVIELGSWSLQSGIQISQFKDAVDELKESISAVNFDRQVAASKAGIVLESILDFITLKYSCALPRNGRNEYTLGDLVGGVDSKLSKLLKIKRDDKEIELKPLLDAAVSAQWIRNCVGCHFNLSGSDVTDQEVKNFAVSVTAISDIIICSKCHTLPKKNSGSFWHCSCKDNHLELHPLTQPGASPRSLEDGE